MKSIIRWRNLFFLPFGATLLFFLLLYVSQHRFQQIQGVSIKTSDVPKAQIPKKPFVHVLPQVTLESIFAEHTPLDLASLPSDRVITLIATGDIIPARSVNFQTNKYNDYTWPYLKTADTIKKADITFINLETPLLANCPITNEGMIFCGSIKQVEGLTFAGIDVASLANNHAGNHGKEGVEETVEVLKKAGIMVTGAKNNPAYITVKRKKFAFLGYNDIEKQDNGVSLTDDSVMKQEISKTRENADIVIVTFHWGIEYQAQPDERQIELGHRAVDLGADLVIGNHPHWIQPVEIYKGRLITYAHGNFVFDQMWSQKTREGVVGTYTFFDDKLIDAEFLPVEIIDYGQPYFLEGEQKERIVQEMSKKSQELANTSLYN